MLIFTSIYRSCNNLRPTSVLVIVLLLTSLTCPKGHGADTTTDQFVQVILHAQAANESRYPSGKLHFEMYRDQVDQSKPNNDLYEIIDGDVMWLDNHVLTRLKRWGSSQQKVNQEEPTADQEVCILAGNKSLLFNSRSLVIISAIAGKEISSEFQVTPKNYWYRSQLYPSYPLIKVFDLKQIPKAMQATAQIEAHGDPAGTVRFLRKNRDLADTVTGRYSLRQDGNLTDYLLDAVSSRLKIEGRFEWSMTPSGQIYLKKMFRDRSEMKDNGVVHVLETCEISEFDPGFKPTEDAFTLKGLQLPHGTIVEDKTIGRTYRTGDRAVQTVAENLNQLSQSMKSRGFAAPSR